MITSIRLQNFKGHTDTTVPLGRFTVLVGPNGSGKTSVLEALWLQSRLVDDSFAHVLAGDWSVLDLHRHGASGALAICSTGTGASEAWSLSMSLGTGEYPDQKVTWNNQDIFLGPFDAPGRVRELDDTAGPAAFYKLSAQQIAAATYSDQTRPRVERDGTNTPEALAALKLGYDEVFERIEREMTRIVPNVERVRIRPVTVTRPNPHNRNVDEQVKGSKIYFDFRGAGGVPAHAASEGTLITLALLTILHSPERPRVLLLDDFDQSLHPQAQMELVRLIKRLLDENPDLQIIATTHSPFVLDQLDPSEVHGFALRPDGTVASKRLSDHPEAQKMKGVLTTGQLWSLDPEPKWVLQDQAS